MYSGDATIGIRAIGDHPSHVARELNVDQGLGRGLINIMMVLVSLQSGRVHRENDNRTTNGGKRGKGLIIS